MPPTSQTAVSLQDGRLLLRLRRGEPQAFQALWQAWRDPIWSVCVAMGADRDGALALLKSTYADLPRAVRTWGSGDPLCCSVAAHVFAVIVRDLQLAPPDGIHVNIPSSVGAPDPARVRAVLQELEPNVRLTYVLDLFFGCSATTLAELLELDEDHLRSARSFAAWRVVQGGGG